MSALITPIASKTEQAECKLDSDSSSLTKGNSEQPKKEKINKALSKSFDRARTLPPGSFPLQIVPEDAPTVPLQNVSLNEPPVAKPRTQTIRHSVEVTEVGALVQFKYLELSKLLGEGSFGSVYSGHYFDQPVAIKELKDTQTFSVEALDEFYHEAKLHFNIRHRNIVGLLCFNVDRSLGKICMVMEKLECSLHEYLHENNNIRQSVIMSDSRKLEMIEDMAKGMHYLHSNNILHLDIKSMNMLLDEHGVIKIADFGLSRVKEEIKRDIDEDGSSASGSIPWMAPELMWGSKPTFQADVFSFYVIMWEVMTERIPHEKKTSMKIIQFVSRKKKKLDMPKNMPHQLKVLFNDCSDFDPEMRPTMQQVCERLREVIDNPEWRVRSLASLEGQAAYQYKLKDPSTVLQVMASPNGEEIGSTISGKTSFNVKEHRLVARKVLGKQDQVFLELARSEGWVRAFDPNTGKLLVEQIQGPENERIMVNKAADEGVEHLCNLFRTHISNMHVALHACIKIHDFEADDDARNVLVAAGIAYTLVQALESYPSHDHIRENVLVALNNLASRSVPFRTQMFDVGIVVVLQRDFGREDLEEKVDELCHMLRLARMVSEIPKGAKAIGVLCPDIIKLLTRFRGKERFQQIGWGCVFYMTKDCPENRETLRHLGACEEVCIAMESFAETRFVYDVMLAAHGLATQNGASQDALVDAGAFEIIVKFMERVSDDPKLVMVGTHVLVDIIPNNERNGAKLREAGVCRAIVNAMPVVSMSSPELSIHAVRVLWCSVVNRKLLVDAGVSLQFSSAIVRHCENEKLLISIVNMIMNISLDITAAHEIAKEMDWGVYFLVMKKFTRNSQLQEFALGAVANICTQVNEMKIRETLGGAGACDATMLALANHLDSTNLLQTALKTVYVLSLHSEPNQERFRALNVRSTVQEGIDKHTEVKSVTHWGQACFSIL